jgi:hypothetical protein
VWLGPPPPPQQKELIPMKRHCSLFLNLSWTFMMASQKLRS